MSTHCHLLFPSSEKPQNFCFYRSVLPWTFNISRITQQMIFYDRLRSLSVMFSRFVYVVACFSIFLIVEEFHCVNMLHFIFHYMMDSFSKLLVIMSNAAINVHVQVFVWTYIFFSLLWGIKPRNGIVGSYGDYI